MGIRNSKAENILIIIAFWNGLPRRPVGPPYPFCPFGTFPLDKGNRPRNDRFFDRLGSPCGGAGTASAVTERAASLVKGRWHGEAVTEGFRSLFLFGRVHPRGPPHPSWLRHATFSPAGAKAIAVLMLGLIALWRSPHPPQCAHWGTFSQEKAFVSDF